MPAGFFGVYEMVRRATCCCGQTSIETFGDPVFQGVCHCDNCKRRSGSALGISAYFEDDQIRKLAGATRTYRIESDDIQERQFCTNCGTTLYWTNTAIPGRVGVAGGCFIDPLPEPGYSASHHSRLEWVEIPRSWEMSGN